MESNSSIPPPPPPLPGAKINNTQNISSNDSQPPPPPPPPGANFKLPQRIPQINNNSNSNSNKNNNNNNNIESTDIKITSPPKTFTTKIEWETTTEVTGTGSGSVFFVEFEKHAKVVVKGSTTIVQEIFASKIAKQLKVAVPRDFMIQYGEGRQWSAAKHYMAQKAPQHIKRRVEKELNRAFIQVMEFLNGADVYSVGMTEEGRKLLRESETLIQIGRILGFDVLINNWDRIPLIWNNEGNGSNLVFCHHKLYAIDQAITRIRKDQNAAGHAAYMLKVEELIRDLIDHPRSENSMLDRVKEWFEMSAGVCFSPQEIDTIRRSLIETLLRIVEIFSLESLNAIKQQVRSMCVLDWDDVFVNGVNMIDTDFMFDIVCVIRSHVESLNSALQHANHLLLCESYHLSPSPPLQTAGHSPHSIKITIFQQSGIRSGSIDRFLEKEKEPKTDILILPEYYLPEPHRHDLPIEDQPLFIPYLEVAKKHNVYMLLGSGSSFDAKTKKSYNSTVLINEQGVIGRYDKRKPIGESVTPGDRIGIWDTALGRIAVMICFDIENADIFEENIALRPDLILNPVMIHKPKSKDREMIASHWNLGMNQMAHKFEALVREHNTTIVRCDASYCLGSSQVISPVCTMTAPRSDDCIFSFFLPKQRPALPPPFRSSDHIRSQISDEGFGFERSCIPPPYVRSDRKDNTGSRYLVRPIQLKGDVIDSTLTSKFLISSDHQSLQIFDPLKTLKLFDHHTSSPIHLLRSTYVDDDNYHSFSNNRYHSHRFLSANMMNVIEVWDTHLDTFHVSSSFQADDTISDLTLSENMIFSLSPSSVISMWDRRSPNHTPISRFESNHPPSLPSSSSSSRRLIFDPSSQLLVSSSHHDRSISLFDIRKHQLLTSLHLFNNDHHDNNDMSMTLCSPSSQLVVASGNSLSRISLGDFSASPLTYSLTSLKDSSSFSFTCLCSIDSDDRKKSWLLVGGSDGVVRAVDASFCASSYSSSGDDPLFPPPTFYQFEISSSPLKSLCCNDNFFSVSSENSSFLFSYHQNRKSIPWSSAFI